MSSCDVTDFYDLSPTEFEEYCYNILKGYFEEKHFDNYTIEHDKKIKTHDGKYQIDIYASFEVGGCEFKTICECKRYKNPVNREKVVILHKKLDSIGAQKGILMTNSRFQSGAIQYAKSHGIALIQVTKRGLEHYSHSNGTESYDENDPFIYGEKQLPPYKAILVTDEKESECIVYPTKYIIKSIIKKMAQMIKEQYEIDIDFDT